MKKIKNILLLVSGVITGMLVYLNNITPSQACVYLGHANSLECGDTVFNIGIIFLVSIPIFVISIITYFMKEQIISAWLKFAYWWVPLTMFLVFLASFASGPSYFPNLLSNRLVSFLMYCLFFIISLIIIIVQVIKVYFLKKKSN
jgi:hypothetical protein